MSVANVSRTELISWINELLNLNYTKVEQCGSGAVYCHIIDSIYGNVPLGKVNFTAKHDYEYISNFKVLQEAFKRNRIDKPIPVERLIKCKMQDNLEFGQWIKKFWDANFPGTEYDAEGRRSGAAANPPPLHGATTVGAARTTAARAPAAARSSVTGSTGAVRRGGAVVGGPARVVRNGGAAGVPNETIHALTAQMDEMKVSVDSLEKERDFYFTKLRDIEMIAQERLQLLADSAPEDADEDTVNGGGEGEVLRQIQAILYSTEDGFEVPEGNEPLLDEEETF